VVNVVDDTGRLGRIKTDVGEIGHDLNREHCPAKAHHKINGTRRTTLDIIQSIESDKSH
jgi:hypothetical protein